MGLELLNKIIAQKVWRLDFSAIFLKRELLKILIKKNLDVKKKNNPNIPNILIVAVSSLQAS